MLMLIFVLFILLFMIFVYLLCGWCAHEDMLCILQTLLFHLNNSQLQIILRLDAVCLPGHQGHHHPPDPGPAPAAVHHHSQLQEQVQDQESHCKQDQLLLHIFRDAKIFKPLLTKKLHNTIVDDNHQGLW